MTAAPAAEPMPTELRQPPVSSPPEDPAAARARQNIAVEAQRYLARNEQVFRQFYICGKTVLAGCKFAPLCGKLRPVRAVFGVTALCRMRRAGIAGQKNGERQSRAQRRQRREQPQGKFAGGYPVCHKIFPQKSFFAAGCAAVLLNGFAPPFAPLFCRIFPRDQRKHLLDERELRLQVFLVLEQGIVHAGAHEHIDERTDDLPRNADLANEKNLRARMPEV